MFGNFYDFGLFFGECHHDATGRDNCIRFVHFLILRFKNRTVKDQSFTDIAKTESIM